MSERLLAAFSGQVDCHQEPKPPRLVLSGVERGRRTPLRVLINAPGPLLPAGPLMDTEIYEATAGIQSNWILRSGTRLLNWSTGSVQVHRDASLALQRVLPPQPLSWTTRAQWRLLLLALRVPGMVRLVQWLRE